MNATRIAVAARRAAGPIVRFVRHEPALAVSLGLAFADALTQAQADGLDPFSAVRFAVIAAGGLFIRRSVEPLAKQLPPPAPPAG